MDLLDKAVWSDADFDQMSWNDTTLWAIGLVARDPQETLGSSGELMLDLDYIVRWNDPVPPEEHFPLQ